MVSFEMQKTVLTITMMLAIAGFLFPASGAVFPGGQYQTGPVVTSPELNRSDSDIANHSIPYGYQTSPEAIRVEVTISDTLIPGPKGEMQAGPRSIGLTLSPALLLVFFASVLLGAGTWFILKKKPADQPAEESEVEEKKEENRE